MNDDLVEVYQLITALQAENATLHHAIHGINSLLVEQDKEIKKLKSDVFKLKNAGDCA